MSSHGGKEGKEGKGSGLLNLAPDLVVDEAVFVGNGNRSGSGSAGRSGSGRVLLDEFADLDELQFLRLEGEDVQGRRVVRVVGKFFPASVIDGGRLKRYVGSKLTNEIQDEQFCIVYFHTTVNRGENSPGMLNLRRIYEDLPQELRKQLEAIYVVHPGLKSRFLLATIGRFFLSEGFYSKLQYFSRVEFLEDHVRKGQVEIPEFVQEHDQDLEISPLMDYGFEANPLGYEDGPVLGATSRFGAGPLM